MKVKCTNTECEKVGVVVEVPDWDGMSTGALSKLLLCPSCGRKRSIVELPVEERQRGITINLGHIASMTPQERHDVLKKRSNAHYERVLKSKKEYLDRQVYKKGELRNFIDVLQKYYNVVEIWHPSDKEGTYRLLVVQEFSGATPVVTYTTVRGKDVTELAKAGSYTTFLTNGQLGNNARDLIETKLNGIPSKMLQFSQGWDWVYHSIY